MLKSYDVESVSELYYNITNDLLNGSTTSPRGIETRELIAPRIVIHNPRLRLVYNEKRKFNLFHALNEALHLYSNSDKVEDIAEFNKNMAKFSDDGLTMHGSYGKRISYYINAVVQKIKFDNDSRQAVLTIHKVQDTMAITKDVPCTIALQFLLRDDKLHMITTMRSNDILFGFQFDVFMFTMLQEAIANTLGVDIGSYVHDVGSMHIYKDYPAFNGFDMLENMRDHSYQVYMPNNSDIYQWYALDMCLKDKLKVHDFLSGTVKDVYDLIRTERDLKNKNVQVNFPKCYNNSPDWAKPFIGKWGR